MEIKVTGEPTPTVKFFKDGKELIETEKLKFIKLEETHYVSFHSAKLTDSGTYSMVATNELSQSTENWNFTVYSEPKVIKKLDSEYIVNEKEDIVLSVKVDSNPEPTVKWFKDGKEISSKDSRVKITADGNNYTLNIVGAARTDCGVYKAEFTNKHGSNFDEATVNVRCGAQIKRKLKDITVNEGDVNVELTVFVEGYPKPTIQWFYESSEITEKRTEFSFSEEGDKIKQEFSYKMTMKEMTAEMMGKYSCKVKNEFGGDECESMVTVDCKPRIKKTLKDTEVNEGETLLLEVEIYGVPEPTIVW